MTDLLDNSDFNLFQQQSHLQQNKFQKSESCQLPTPLQNQQVSVQQNLPESQQNVISQKQLQQSQLQHSQQQFSQLQKNQFVPNQKSKVSSSKSQY